MGWRLPSPKCRSLTTIQQNPHPTFGGGRRGSLTVGAWRRSRYCGAGSSQPRRSASPNIIRKAPYTSRLPIFVSSRTATFLPEENGEGAWGGASNLQSTI